MVILEVPRLSGVSEQQSFQSHKNKLLFLPNCRRVLPLVAYKFAGRDSQSLKAEKTVQ